MSAIYTHVACAALFADIVDHALVQPPGKIFRGEPIDVDVTWDPARTQIHAQTGAADLENENVCWRWVCW